MNFENIVNKFNYSKDFSIVLKEIYEELVKMFKNEELVYEALLNTEIVSVSNVYDYLKDNKLLESDDTLVTDNDLKRSSGVCQTLPVINFVDGKFELTDVKRVVAVVNLDLTNTSSKATLIHELCHLIKSYYNEYKIEGNILTCHSGLITYTYELSFDGVNIKTKLVNEIGVGLEEGITSVQEEVITRNIYDKEYKAGGYGVVNAMAANLLELMNMDEIVTSAEIYHDKSELYNALGLEDYLKLENLGDRVYKLSLDMFAAMQDFNKMTGIAEQLKKVIREEYAPLRDAMENNLKRN